MRKKKICMGCGVQLQDENILQEGYTTDLKNDLCQRCFRMKNYGEYQVVTKSNEEYIEILKSIGKTKDLVLLIVDVTNIDKDLSFMREYLSNPTLLVLNKRDILPKSVPDEKILSYIKELDIPFVDILLVSSMKKYHIDELYKKIMKYKVSNKVYVVGHTNVGKSSVINQLIRSYSTSEQELTISPLPSTTLNKLEIEINNKLTLIDTPGLIDRGNIANYIDEKELKRIQSKKEMRPRTFQIKMGQCLVIDNFARVDYVKGEKNSFTVYVSNNLKVKKMNALKQERLKDLSKTTYEMKYYEDLVLNGLGWIKMVGRGTVDLYIDRNVETFVRKNVI